METWSVIENSARLSIPAAAPLQCRGNARSFSTIGQFELNTKEPLHFVYLRWYSPFWHTVETDLAKCMPCRNSTFHTKPNRLINNLLSVYDPGALSFGLDSGFERPRQRLVKTVPCQPKINSGELRFELFEEDLVSVCCSCVRFCFYF